MSIIFFVVTQKPGYNLLPKSCTSENEKDNFLFYIKVLCEKQKESSFTDEVK